jgi:hypothetical protein
MIVAPKKFFPCVPWLVLATAASLLIGCSESGPPRYDVSGTVTYKGQPVPVGSIIFQPDPAGNNEGPYGSATIKDGKFDTRNGGEPTTGGSQIVLVEAFDGKVKNAEYAPYGQSIGGGYQKRHELPQAHATLNIELTEDE